MAVTNPDFYYTHQGGEFVDFQRPSGKWVLAKVLREEAGAAWVEDLGTGKRELVSIATGRLASCGAFTEESKEDLERQDDESFFAATLESRCVVGRNAVAAAAAAASQHVLT